MASTRSTGEERRKRKNASLNAWRSKNRERYNAYIRAWRAKRKVQETRPASRTRTTTVEIDEAKFAEARRVLGTRSLRETVERSFDEVLARDAREKTIERLRTMKGLDLDKPEVMAKAWR